MAHDTLTLLQQHAADTLHPGEAFTAAVPVGRVGSAAASLAGPTTFGHDGFLRFAEVELEHHEADKDAAALGDFAHAPMHFGAHGLIVATTGERFLVFERSATGRPAVLTHEWPLADIRIDVSRHRLALVKIDMLRFVLPDHTIFTAECMDPKHGGEVRQLASTMQRAA